MRSALIASVMIAGWSAASLCAAETPFSLISPVYPMVWNIADVSEGGTVYELNSAVEKAPEEFAANAKISDTLSQVYIDALSLKVGNIRVNQAGYLPDDPEKRFYYATVGECSDDTYSVVDLQNRNVMTGGKFSDAGASVEALRTLIAYENSITTSYSLEVAYPKKNLCVGKLADLGVFPTNERLRIKVGKEYSSTFIVSDRVYSMVRDANLKFFGVQRSGDSESWFHKASHIQDPIPGGWYDAGDNLKLPSTMGYAFMMLSLLSATNPERDEDHYAFNHGEIVNTDGIPDMLREARHGAEFFLRSYEYAKGDIEDMIVNIGDENDHLYWNRVDNMESMTPIPARPVLHGMGPTMSAQVAAGLALLSVSYAGYDKVFADSCLKVAEELYSYSKKNRDNGEVCTVLYSCYHREDVDALAAIALHYATYQKTEKMDYLNDAAENKNINDNTINHQYHKGYFAGGWLGMKTGFNAGGWVSDYDNRYSITLYAFYKLLLADKATAAKYGISDSVRVDYTERVVYSLAKNASEAVTSSGKKSIELPYEDATISLIYSAPWCLQFSFAWGTNFYETGEIINLLTYAEVARDIEAKKTLSGNWNHADVRQLAINKMNYILGANQWDICFMVGVGDKNESHVHHRTANPEFWNGTATTELGEVKVTAAPYSYRPPVGALLGGSMDGSLLSDVEKYTSTETTLWGNTSFLAANVLLAADRKTSTDAVQKKTAKVSTRLSVSACDGMVDISYEIPSAEQVSVSLVSVSGKQAMRYNPGYQSAGEHVLQWNVVGLAAGAYIVKLSAGKYHDYKFVKLGR